MESDFTASLSQERKSHILQLKALGFTKGQIVEFSYYPNISEIVSAAEEGDTEAAKLALTLASAYLIPPVSKEIGNTESSIGLHSPYGYMPLTLRSYLQKAIQKIISSNIRADVALNLKRPSGGAPKIPKGLQHLVWWYIDGKMQSEGKSLEDAASDAADFMKTRPEYFRMYQNHRSLSEKTLTGYYTTEKKKREKLRQAVEEFLRNS